MDLVIELLRSEGSYLVLGIAILELGRRGVWKWGSDYTKLEAERDDWKAMALDGLVTARRAMELLDQKNGGSE